LQISFKKDKEFYTFTRHTLSRRGKLQYLEQTNNRENKNSFMTAANKCYQIPSMLEYKGEVFKVNNVFENMRLYAKDC
jgi:hypothetical protein